jgi:hypothetical protein
MKTVDAPMITDEQYAALRAFYEAYGKNWRPMLKACWRNGIQFAARLTERERLILAVLHSELDDMEKFIFEFRFH